MDCKQWRDRASDYIEGSLSDSAIESMEVHSKECASCRAEEASLRALMREMESLPVVEPPMFFRENLISAIENGSLGAKRPAPSFWQTLFSGAGKTVAGSLVAGGAMAALFLSMTSARQDVPVRNTQAGTLSMPDISVTLPGAGNENNSPGTPILLPRLRVGQVTTIQTDGSPAYDFTVWMENAQEGSARFRLLNDKHIYRFNLGNGRAPQTLRVPLSAARGENSLGISVRWSADGKNNTRYLFVPVPSSENASPQQRQSFGLPEASLLESAKMISERYATPVTLENLSSSAVSEPIRITARDETAAETLTRNLAQSNIRVTSVASGILLSPKEGTAP